MFLERFRNVVQTILTQNPQIFFGLRPDHGFPPLLENLHREGGGTYGYRLMWLKFREKYQSEKVDLSMIF